MNSKFTALIITTGNNHLTNYILTSYNKPQTLFHERRETRDERRATINMQNKPNLPKAQMNLTSLITVDYENKSNWKLGENKPNTDPIKPNLLNAQMNVNEVLTKEYENVRLCRRGENKPKTNPTCRGVASGEAGSNPASTFCWGCHTRKIMFCNRLNGKCQFKMAKT